MVAFKSHKRGHTKQQEGLSLVSESSNAGDTPAAAVEVLEELTESEADDRHQLELKVERAFFIAGQALAELRERKLYRSTHRSFEQYCRERFSFTHRHVNYLGDF